MHFAYILFSIKPGNVATIIRELRDMHEVKEIYTLNGIFDVICKVEALSLNNIKNIISKKIRRIYGVNTTITLMVT